MSFRSAVCTSRVLTVAPPPVETDPGGKFAPRPALSLSTSSTYTMPYSARRTSPSAAATRDRRGSSTSPPT